MNTPIDRCPGILSPGYDTYSPACRRRMFSGRKVHHVLPYDSPAVSEESEEAFDENRKRISISGIQDKFSVLLEKNKLRLTKEGERGGYILKPIPAIGKRSDQMPANEHLTMQLARQVFDIETAENSLIFFRDGTSAYLTKRFDALPDDEKLAKEDFASLAGLSPQTHGEHYKYQGSYLTLFELMVKYVPSYQLEVPKLWKRLIFNYLFSNGDAHFKNFSLLETPLGDFRLSPAYDLLNTGIHVEDSDFALSDGLLPRSMTQGKVREQFDSLGMEVGLSEQQLSRTWKLMLSSEAKVLDLVSRSYLDERGKRSYAQMYQTRLNKLMRK